MCLIFLGGFWYVQRYLVVFRWRLSDSKSPKAAGTLLSILAGFNNDVFWMVSIPHSISYSSKPLSKALGTVPNAPITIITVTLMFHSLF